MKLIMFNWWHPDVRPDGTNDDYWDKMIHNNDLEKAYGVKFISNIFKEVGQEDNFVLISQLTDIIRVRRDCVENVDYEGLFFGDKVNVVGSNNTPRQGTIYRVYYHDKNKKLWYEILDSNGRKISKRYFAADLKKII